MIKSFSEILSNEEIDERRKCLSKNLELWEWQVHQSDIIFNASHGQIKRSSHWILYSNNAIAFYNLSWGFQSTTK